MPAAAPPAIIAARSKITHSGRLNPRMATLPPAGNPSAISARAAVRTSTT